MAFQTKEMGREDEGEIQREEMSDKRITVVFKIVESDAFKRFYESHISGEPIHGAIPTILATGDQVSVPMDILNALSQIDPNAINEKLLAELINESERHLNKESK